MNTADPAVSVIILTYNSEGHIQRALTSLRRQTFANFEVIVVDAGSTDRTRDIVAGCALETRWLDLPNSDMGMARNYGVRNSHGRYVMFLDSDDFYLQNKIASQIEALEARPALDAVFCPAYIYRAGKHEKLGIKSMSTKLLTFGEILSGNCYTLGTMCLRRSAWEQGLSFGEGDLGRYGEDWRFQLNLSKLGFAFDFLQEPAVVVELRSDSHTSWEIQPKMKALALASVEEVLDNYRHMPIEHFNKQAVLDEFRFKLAVSLCLVGRKADAENTLAKIKSIKKFAYAKTIAELSTIVPPSWFKRALTLAWTVRQNRSFSWKRPSSDVCKQFSELGVTW